MLESVGTFVLTKDVLDRHSERVIPQGGDLTHFKKNPIMLWNHISPRWWDDGTTKKILPIGIWKNIKKQDDEIVAEGFIETENEFGKEVYNLVKSGVVNAVSIGFIPKEWSDKDEDKLQGQKGYTIKKFELLEASMVDIPANPAATRKSIDGDVQEKTLEYFTDLKSWEAGGKTGLIYKSFNKISEEKNFYMDILKAVNKFFGTSFSGSESEEDVTKALEAKFGDFKKSNEDVLVKVKDAMASFDDAITKKLDEVVEKYNQSNDSLVAEVESLKNQVANIKSNADQHEDGDGDDSKQKPSKEKKAEGVISLMGFFEN